MNVGTAVTKIVDSHVGGGEVAVRNRGAAVVAVGKDGSALTAANGFQVAAGAEESFTLEPGEQLYAVAVSGTQAVDVL
jgi:hypothetical protein